MSNVAPVDNGNIFVYDDKLCYQHDQNQAVMDVMAVDCIKELDPARYLIILIPGTEKILQLCEVEIPIDGEGRGKY